MDSPPSPKECDEVNEVSPFDILNLHRPTPVTALIESVPKPEGSELEKGLPTWKSLPLGIKLPMKHAPEGAVVFTRGNLGEKLWKGSKLAEFTLADPYCHEVTYNYDALHDFHLKEWFANEANKKPLLKGNLINSGGVVPCRLKLYNEFRRYLNRLHTDNVNYEKSLKDEYDQEVREVAMIQKNYKADIQRLKKREAMAELLSANRMEENKKLERKREVCQKRLRRADLAHDRIMRERADDKVMRAMEGAANDEEIKRKKVLSMKIERKRRSDTIKKLRRDDELRDKRRAKAAEEALREKKLKEEKRWDEKIFNDDCQAKKKQELFTQFERYNQLNVDRRKERARLRQIACEQQFMKIKSKKVIENVKKKSIDDTGKLAKEILKHLLLKEPMYGAIDSSTRHEEIYEALTLMKPEIGRYNQALEIRKLWPSMEHSRNQPQGAIALNRQLKMAALEFLRVYIVEQLRFIVKAAKEEVKQSGICPGSKFLKRGYAKTEVMEEVRKRTRIRRKTANRSISSQPASYNLCLEELGLIARQLFNDVGVTKSFKDAMSSFELGDDTGSIKSVRFSNDVSVKEVTIEDGSEMKSTRERAPTPLPSVVTLTVAAFSEPTGDAFSNISEIEIPNPFIMGELKRFCKRLFRLIFRRAIKMRLIGFRPILPRRCREDTANALSLLLMETPIDDIQEEDLSHYVDILTEHVLYPEMRPLKFLEDDEESEKIYCCCDDCRCARPEEDDVSEDSDED